MKRAGRRSAAELSIAPIPPEPTARKQPPPIRTPAGLAPATARWFRAVVADYELEEHHLRLLELACRSWDRAEQARVLLDAEGLTCSDRYGTPKARPEVQIERDHRVLFARLTRELDLDTGAPQPRPPALHSNRRG
jgi:phage terminase small subunit